MVGDEDDGLTVYVGGAGEKYSDPSDWRELIIERRLTPEAVVPIRRGQGLTHLRAADVPELGAIFDELIPGPTETLIALTVPIAAAELTTEPTAEKATGSSTARVAPLKDSAHHPPLGSSAGPRPREDGVIPASARVAAPSQPFASAGKVQFGRDETRPFSKVGKLAFEKADVTQQLETARQGGRRTSISSYFVRCLTRDFVRVSGRAPRKEYGSYALGLILVLIGGLVAVGMLATGASGLSYVVTGALVLFCLYAIIPTIAVSIRRLHDLGASAWLLLVVLIPYIGGPLLLLACVFPSQAGANRYGPAPGATS